MTKMRDAKLWEGYYSASPVLSQVGVRPQREGKSNSFQDEEGIIRQIEHKKTSVTTQRKLEEAKGMTLTQFCEAASEPGREMGKAIVSRLFDMFHKASEESGNVVDAGGGPLTYDLFLQVLEKIRLDFSSDGTPMLPSLNLGSEAHAQFERLWPEWIKTPDFQIRFNQILDRKREEFYEREACRRLVD
jgi:hypothetical protein